MFGNKKQLDQIETTIKNLGDKVLSLRTIVIDAKIEIANLKAEVLKNRNTTIKRTEPTIKKVEVEKIVEVNISKKPRKKYRKRLAAIKTMGRISTQEKIEMKKLFDQGCTMLEISHATNRSASAIGRFLHKLEEGFETLPGIKNEND